jgi:archaellum component FlaC
MKSLQKFRKDELVLQEESDDEVNSSDDMTNNKEQNSVEEAYNLVESIDNRMDRINQAIRGIDKRISYNYRLIGSVVPIDYQHLLQN